MNGHDLRVGMRVRVVRTDRNAFVLGKDTVSGKNGTVKKVGPAVLGSMPNWASVDLDGDTDNPHRFCPTELEELERPRCGMCCEHEYCSTACEERGELYAGRRVSTHATDPEGGKSP